MCVALDVEALMDVNPRLLAVKNKGCIITFDQRIALNAVHGAKMENLVVL